MKEPTPKVIEELERVAYRRAEIEAVSAADAHEAAVRRHLLATLDEMEEALCHSGSRARAVRAGWKRLAAFESFGREGGSGGSK